jgi:predicted house-cleaning NTP pyrophosphatase (Maf/HAM1 superfamily)
MGLANRYTVTLSSLDEEALQIELVKTPNSPTEYAKKLAESKAFALAEHMANNRKSDTSNSNGSDTIVDKDGMILEKYKREQQAVQMLTRLSGSWFQRYRFVLCTTYWRGHL